VSKLTAAESANLAFPSRDFTAVGMLRLPAALVSQFVAVALLVIIIVLAVWHIDQYPRTWFDEGSYLQVARNLVERHEYAAVSADGTRDYAPVVGVGPTMLLPIALAFRLVGVSLEAARIVPAIYLIVGTVLVWSVSRRLFGAASALITLALLVALPALDWLATGRQALGELPALVFLILGGITASRAQKGIHVVGAGAVLGLAMVTKGQYLLILPASIVAVAAIDLIDARLRPLRWYVLLLAGAATSYAAWLGTLLVVMGDGQIVENVRLLRGSSAGALFVFDFGRMVAGARLLLGPSSFMLVLPAALAGIHAIRSAEGDRRLAISALWVFQGVWLTWFAFASIAWPRYAFAGIAINAMFMGYLVMQLATYTAHRASHRRSTARFAAWIAALAFCAVIAGSTWRQASPIFTTSQTDPQQFAATLDRAVPPAATVAGWEPEIGFLARTPIHDPPLGSLDRVVRARWLGSGTGINLGASIDTDYLIVGPFGRWVGAYDSALSSSRYVLIEAVGEYELYLRVKPK
jgi:4-amino-4-deoxy-L-arabinose transferase-like glycosyltransferase